MKEYQSRKLSAVEPIAIGAPIRFHTNGQPRRLELPVTMFMHSSIQCHACMKNSKIHDNNPTFAFSSVWYVY